MDTSISFGLFGNNVNEILETKYSQLSELKWKNPINFALSIEENVFINRFVSDIGIQFILPNDWGTMFDYDYYISGNLSQFSKHKNYLDKNLFLYINFGYKFFIKKFIFTPFFELKYQETKFSAWDGYINTYKNINSESIYEEKINLYGNGISYEQKKIFLFLKFNNNYSFNKDLSFISIISICPYFYSKCIDTHYFRNKQFTDIINLGYAFNFDIQIKYRKYAISLFFEYIKSLQKNARTYTSDIGAIDYNNKLMEGYIPGIESFVWSINFIYYFK